MIWIILLGITLIGIILYITKPFGKTIMDENLDELDVDEFINQLIKDYHPEEDDDKDEAEMS